MVHGRFLEDVPRIDRPSQRGRSLITDLHRRASTTETGEINETSAKLTIQAALARAGSGADGAVEQLKGLLAALNAVQGWDTRHERALALMALGRVHYSFCRRPAEAIEPLREAEGVFAQLESERGIDSTNRAAVLGAFRECVAAPRPLPRGPRCCRARADA